MFFFWVSSIARCLLCPNNNLRLQDIKYMWAHKHYFSIFWNVHSNLLQTKLRKHINYWGNRLQDCQKCEVIRWTEKQDSRSGANLITCLHCDGKYYKVMQMGQTYSRCNCQYSPLDLSLRPGIAKNIENENDHQEHVLRENINSYFALKLCACRSYD